MARFFRFLLPTAVLAAALLPASAAPAKPGWDLMYITLFYSDATYTDIVGRQRDICTQSGVSTGPVIGTATDYYIDNAVAYCYNGNKYPL